MGQALVKIVRHACLEEQYTRRWSEMNEVTKVAKLSCDRSGKGTSEGKRGSTGYIEAFFSHIIATVWLR